MKNAEHNTLVIVRQSMTDSGSAHGRGIVFWAIFRSGSESPAKAQCSFAVLSIRALIIFIYESATWNDNMYAAPTKSPDLFFFREIERHWCEWLKPGSENGGIIIPPTMILALTSTTGVIARFQASGAQELPVSLILLRD